MGDYPHWQECDLVDRLRCVAIEAEAAGLPGPMLQAIHEAADRLEVTEPEEGQFSRAAHFKISRSPSGVGDFSGAKANFPRDLNPIFRPGLFPMDFQQGGEAGFRHLHRLALMTRPGHGGAAGPVDGGGY